MTIYDAHVHVGRFRDGLYFDPIATAKELMTLGVERWVVSSTTTAMGIDRYDETISELDAMESAAPGRGIPLLWLLPEMLENIDRFLHLRFKGLKLHNRATFWYEKEIAAAFDLAEQRQLPLIIHTGGDERNDAGFYRQQCANHPNARIVLAHGRPLDQALQILQSCPHVMVDTAYMPVEDVRAFIDHGYAMRIIWGSDYPIDRHFFPEENPMLRYKSHIKSVRAILDQRMTRRLFAGAFSDIFLSKTESRKSLIR